MVAPHAAEPQGAGASSGGDVLRRLTDPDIPRWRTDCDGRPVLQMPLRRGMVLHAPTGALLWQFREVALLGRSTRVADLVQPAFTRT
ncbi:hypothetical protein [Streptomyces sp. NPDC002573]|uniref:hypothetical protein n=1 Tax=Streptomyces sp. NPDC002573 TaxID=3364651 RepID=UPI0036957A08